MVSTASGEASAPPRSVKSAERTLRILEILGAASGPLSVVELHHETGYPRSSLHQLLHTMSMGGWVDMADDGGQVSIGAQALVVGTSYLDRDPAIPFAASALENARDSLGYTTHYARLDGSQVLYLATRETTNSHRRTSRVGRRLPAFATALGKVLLADLTPSERQVVLGENDLEPLTKSTVTTPVELEKQLESTRERGYSVEREENTMGVVCVGVTVRYRIPATDAMSCSIPLGRASDDEIERVAHTLSSHARALAETLQSAGVR